MSERMSDGEIEQYARGMRDGTLMFVGLVFGENINELLSAESFAQLRFSGEVPRDLVEWLLSVRERALETTAGEVAAAGKLRRDLLDWDDDAGA